MPHLFVENFSLPMTLESGQHFRYAKVGKWYFVTARGMLFKARQEGERLFYEGAPREFITDFFALDEPYEKILRSISRDEVMSAAIMECLGLRIMRQDPWECAVSFVLSSNSNIPRITRNITDICRAHGQRIELDGFSAHSFPSPHSLARSRKLAGLALGYREPFVRKLASAVEKKPLDELRDLPFDEALARIVELPGIGDKVGQCVLLFSLGHGEAFPVDVWIEKAMKSLYGLDSGLSGRYLQTLGRTYFGRHAGYAQQFLYHYIRTNKHLCRELQPDGDARDNGRKTAPLI